MENTERKCYLIGNAHIDPVWLWRWQEGYTEVLATFRSALDRMKDFDDFKFTSAGMVYYEWVEKTDPAMFEEIKERIKEGRWCITGGWFLQPDCNLPCGESFARHALISQKYFKEKFGVTAKCGYNVDSFGHNANMPKILKNSGINNYVFMRPSVEESGIDGSVFKWESSDGSRVNAFRIHGLYNIDAERMELLDEIIKMSYEDNIDHMAFVGVGNHGGGPTINVIDKIKQENHKEAFFSTPDEYFADLNSENLPVVSTELQHHARGCYSACTFAKENNRRCENNILAAEALSVMANKLTGLAYPHKKLNKAWKNLMFNQFHDILAGCAIKSAYDDAGYLYGEIMSITEQIINSAMQKICLNIDTLNGETLPSYRTGDAWMRWTHEVLGTPITVFNPNAFEATTVVSLNDRAKYVTDENGNTVPMQMVRGEQTNGKEDKYNTVFTATVPPMGYRVYRAYFGKEINAEYENSFVYSENTIENCFIKVSFDNKSGEISDIYDKVNDKHILSGACRTVVLDESECDTWAHAKDVLGEEVGEFGKGGLKIIEEGPVRLTMRAENRYNNSVIIRDYSLNSFNSEITVKTVINFNEKSRTLKFKFPTGDNKAIAQIPYGFIERPQNTGEEHFNGWLASGGLSLATSSKYGCDMTDGELAVTVLRTAVYADHYGERDEFCEYMDMGRHDFTYTIMPFESKTESAKQNARLNMPQRVHIGTFHGGDLKESLSCGSVGGDGVIMTALKMAQDGENPVIRFYEAENKDTTAKAELFGLKTELPLAHSAVKTLEITDSGVKELLLTEELIENQKD